MRKDILERLTAIIRSYIEDSHTELTEKTKLRAELGLSSFRMMCLLGDIESEFSVHLRYEDAGKLVTIGDAVTYIEAAMVKD